tara:strand:- start:2073 stop:2837 length:765 start_codon:yes stop_codon:yes gene_type:complete
MWDIVSEVYVKKTNYIPTLIFCGTQEELDSEIKGDFGEVYLLPRHPEVIVTPDYDWSVVWSLYWAIANKFPDDVCLFSGIDEIPITTVLWDKIGEIDEEKYVIPLGRNPYAKHNLYGIVANGHNCAKGSTFKKIFDIEDDLQTELNRVWNLRFECSRRVPQNLFALQNLQNWWGLDEAYVSSKVYEHEDVVFFDDQWAQRELFSKRICRGTGWKYDESKVQENYYWSAHMPRPLSDLNNKNKIIRLLETMGVRR